MDTGRLIYSRRLELLGNLPFNLPVADTSQPGIVSPLDFAVNQFALDGDKNKRTNGVSV